MSFLGERWTLTDTEIPGNEQITAGRPSVDAWQLKGRGSLSFVLYPWGLPFFTCHYSQLLGPPLELGSLLSLAWELPQKAGEGIEGSSHTAGSRVLSLGLCKLLVSCTACPGADQPCEVTKPLGPFPCRLEPAL